ncbi:AMP-binding protein [Chitiniphilus purpureus]|uniref:AMP-binding protein n=1 Tax=Chitiniphilus purpureus TaxID=2981137 RepID=A0ABY6DSC3_9NEIS|nr:AMP-binding protein [Chitiniphilus sp. CD1]UXY17133.1 AMP-binding protein [Chitiniphilus sp. CD1]
MSLRYEQRTRDFNLVWQMLDQCTRHGIYVYDDATSKMCYRSYAQYVADAGKLAAVLARHGIAAGERVLLCAETTPDFPTVWLALIWLGATPVPMPPSYALSGQYTYRERIGGLLPHFKYYCCNADEVAELDAIAQQISSDVKTLALPALLAEAAREPDGPPPARVALNERDHAFIQFTSGSTKAPKGILVSYGNLLANAAALWAGVEVDPDQHRWISWLPLYHDMGLVGMFLSSLISQTTLVLLSPQCFSRRPLQFLAMAEQYQASYCSMPNFAYEWILKRLKSAKVPTFSMRQFRWMGVGAEPVSIRTMAEFTERMQQFGLGQGVVSPCYGLAEATLTVSVARPGEGFSISRHQEGASVTCGRPVPGMEVDVSTGRIRIRGESVAQSALIDGEIVPLVGPDGFYDTKDCGYLEDELIVVLGRADEMFIINGENYFPYDIEAAARGVEGVLKRRAICFQLPAGNEGQRGATVLLYERLPMGPGEEEAVQDAIKSEVLRHTGLTLDVVLGVPARTIPVTPSGKLQRLRARQLYLDGYYHQVKAEPESLESEAV